MNNKKPIQQIDRRTILHGLVAAGGSLLIPSGVFGASSRNRPVSPNEKVNLACVGIGNRGLDVVKALNDTGLVNIVALCDTQMGARHTLDAISLAPGARRFLDFRDMFDKMGKQFDAVSIAIPDHSHFPVAMLAMNQGKHIYVEKPMAHSFRQVELMMAAEKKYKVACQMGNQGHSEANYFQFKAWVEAGIIKNVTKITAFMNAQRRWHGMTVDGFKEAQGLPDVMDWDAWIATAKDIPFNRAYLNGEWRSWYEFGNGALGDWGAHIFDTAHQFLELGMPNEVDLTHVEGHSQWLFPQASTIAFRFPKRGNKPACEMTWYDGQKNLPPLPADFGGVTVDPNIPPP
ncbi:MAG TPA: Gfo/Idh/MocA family oxidoreductase, partial [Fimbriimonas sp.]|nr:Gfo/Idh/MocA family oxidoreductase [Fimbriimonas sp.]